MITLKNEKIYIKDGKICDTSELSAEERENAWHGTMAYSILSAHNTSGNDRKLKLRFDALASHDITYVGIIQTARASGLKEFPLPYVLTNCHNSLCAVGGTINEDDHLFGLSAAKKYGGIYVPAHQAVIHSYMRETMAGCGKMLLGSDSHTRYGALGTMAIGEGGPELVKQLLCKTYDIDYPDIVAVRLTGKLRRGVGPQDVAIALIGAVYANGFVKNSVLEFIGDGIADLPVDLRCGIDVMTTETACLSSIWKTDGVIRDYFETHRRPEDFRELSPAPLAAYDRMIDLDLSTIEPMIALPFHPSCAYTIRELKENPGDILREAEKRAVAQLGLEEGRFRLTDKITSRGVRADQGVIAGCAGGTFDNVCAAADTLRGRSTGNGEFWLSVYPASQPVMTELSANGVMTDLIRAGLSVRTAFCGPCFGAGDVPGNNALSIRHTTRNFPNREGSKPGAGQIARVTLMDARSIAATAANGGIITAATELDIDYTRYPYHYDDSAYRARVFNGWGKAQPDAELKYGPNIKDWPAFETPKENLILEIASVIDDPVTTTDELIPSGETSSYRSNPMKLAEFTLSRKDPGYVARAKAAKPENMTDADRAALKQLNGDKPFSFGSAIFAHNPGDGSAREQAASCQKVLGAYANIADEYATKRYRSNLINWGMLPLLRRSDFTLAVGDFVFLPDMRTVVAEGKPEFDAYRIRDGKAERITLGLAPLTEDEKAIILAGCLMNYWKNK